ncbi:cuticle protein LPCP-23-like [Trichoplusia ni]|uniref:Cuticle protein LPCP-23-like n=1 Tax=Trichoplusia ni TaxID=7111 RepID=A0A7E5VSD9_TRINI|nr:cuticle protein LPCP-23-like [Trichoplusia ni]
MFKFVVLCAFVVAATAEPGVLIPAPYTQYSSYIAPATTTISKQASSVIHPSPAVYSTYSYPALTHFIKKRSPQIPLAYSTPLQYYPNYVATAYNTPLINTAAPVVTQHVASIPAVHLIKKRSAPLIPTTYYTPTTYTAAAPVLASTYTAHAPLYTSSPVISQPIPFAHYIKKRSAALTSIIAPTSYSTQSRFDLRTAYTPYAAGGIAYAAPVSYASPIALSHVY